MNRKFRKKFVEKNKKILREKMKKKKRKEGIFSFLFFFCKVYLPLLLQVVILLVKEPTRNCK